MCDDRDDPRPANALQLVRRSDGKVRPRKFDEHSLRATQRQLRRAKVAARTVEHDLPAEPQLGLWRRRGDQLGEQLAVTRIRRGRDARRLEMRRAHEHLEPLTCEPFEHLDGRRDVGRPVIDARQQMRVDVDHARAADARERTSLAGDRSNSVPTTT